MAGLLTLMGLVGTIVTLARHWPPSMDRAVGHRVLKALNRGRLPLDEPDRSLALRAARSRAMHGWLALSAAGVVLLATRFALEPPAFLPSGVGWAVTALAVAGAMLNALLALQAARALAST
ncbi:hypothetical protein [Aquipuribacter hungaricus]|uniref:Uncharacterized protein n=1 Tax=Aquipuribacter hungaricus TaxID=545624 RepID=A0ABV7WM97_9MICO